MNGEELFDSYVYRATNQHKWKWATPKITWKRLTTLKNETRADSIGTIPVRRF